MRYEADIGVWEKGRCVEFSADTHDLAIKHAFTLVKDGTNEYVVAVRKLFPRPQCIFDYMNGKLS